MGSCHRDGTFEFRAGDIGVPNRSPALTRHWAEFRSRSRQDNPVFCRVKYANQPGGNREGRSPACNRFGRGADSPARTRLALRQPVRAASVNRLRQAEHLFQSLLNQYFGEEN
jgi:hypothetical protein